MAGGNEAESTHGVLRGQLRRTNHHGHGKAIKEAHAKVLAALAVHRAPVIETVLNAIKSARELLTDSCLPRGALNSMQILPNRRMK